MNDFITRDTFWKWFNRDISLLNELLEQESSYVPSSSDNVFSKSMFRGSIPKSISHPPASRSRLGLQSTMQNANQTSRPLPQKKINNDGEAQGEIMQVSENNHEVEQPILNSCRFKICWGRHRPGRKKKVWEDDGFLSIDSLGNVRVTDCRGRPLEEAVVDEDVQRCCETEDEILIGKTEVQIVERLS